MLSACYSPCFEEKTSLKTILNCFYLRFPAFGAIKEPHEPSSCGFFFCSNADISPSEFASQMLVPPVVPLKSHSRLTSFRYTQLVTLLALLREFRIKWYSIILRFIPQQSEPKKNHTTQVRVASFLAPMRTSHRANLLRKCWFHLWCHSSRIVD